MNECRVEDCKKPVRAKKLCTGHYQRLLKYGDPSIIKRREKGSELLHGKPQTYTNARCRCELCAVAWNAYVAGRRSVYKEKGKPKDLLPVEHGYNAYSNYGCRCEICRLEHNATRLKYAYRLSVEEKQLMLESQDGLCAICRKKTPTVVDHKHGTNLIRGLLCHSCNTGLGKLGDSVEGLQAALEYLKNSENVADILEE